MKTRIVYAHYTARALPGLHPFLDEELAFWVWDRLRRSFPLATAVNLMPTHLHLDAPDEGEQGRQKLGRILGASNRALGRSGRSIWEQVPPPRVLATPDKHMRSDRYIWLNANRPSRFQGQWVRLVDEPLAVRGATLHDTIGAVVDPWVPPERLAEAYGWPIDDELPKRIHRYATAADHVVMEARRFPIAPPPSSLPDRPLEDIVAATLIATRSRREALRRRSPARDLFVALAYRQGWRRQRAALAELCDLHPVSISRIVARVRPEDVERAALCLDPQILRCSSPPPTLRGFTAANATR